MTSAMLDNEKNRAEYVVRLEQQVQHLQRQLNEIQTDAKWIPQVSATTDPGTYMTRITLSFGGKRVTASFTQEALQDSNVTDMTTAVIDSFTDNLVKDRLREVVEPEIRRSIEGVKAVEGAGKW